MIEFWINIHKLIQSITGQQICDIFPNMIPIIDPMITLIIGQWFRETFHIYPQYPIYDYTNHWCAIFGNFPNIALIIN